jgi:hypothetical protein
VLPLPSTNRVPRRATRGYWAFGLLAASFRLPVQYMETGAIADETATRTLHPSTRSRRRRPGSIAGRSSRHRCAKASYGRSCIAPHSTRDCLATPPSSSSRAARTEDLDDRAYREAQPAAGLVEGRLHLAAYAQDAGASGMTFLDSEIPALLGEQVDGLLFTCVGMPEYASKPGGSPRSPAAFRQAALRLDDL